MISSKKTAETDLIYSKCKFIYRSTLCGSVKSAIILRQIGILKQKCFLPVINKLDDYQN